MGGSGKVGLGCCKKVKSIEKRAACCLEWTIIQRSGANAKQKLTEQV